MPYLGVTTLLNRSSFNIAYTTAALLMIVFLSLILQAGTAPLSLFLRNDVLTNTDRLIFLLGFPLAFIISLFACFNALKMPRFDFFNRIVTINLIVYSALGLVLSALRVHLFSRTVFLSELLVTTLLLVGFHMLRHRLYPRHLGVLANINIVPFQTYPSLRVTAIWNEIPKGEKLDAVVADLHNQSDEQASHFFSDLAQRRIPVYDASSLIESLWGRITLSELTSAKIEHFKPPEFYSSIKRVAEIFFILITSPIFALVCLIISMAIKLDSKGAVLFQQQRTGRFGVPFTIFKFRSMYTNTNDDSRHFAEKNDRRVTRVGRLLRRLRLDELPQLWNVIKGDMSVIGPRPEQLGLTTRFDQLIPLYGFRHTVRPGITGWAQVMYGYAASDEQTRQKLEFDFYYIKHMSLWLDLVIFSKTVRTILLGTGAR